MRRSDLRERERPARSSRAGRWSSVALSQPGWSGVGRWV